MARELKKQARFNAQLQAIIPHQEVREDVERAIRFAVLNFPESGLDTGIAAPLPVFEWDLHATDRFPALGVAYMFTDSIVLLSSVWVRQERSEE